MDMVLIRLGSLGDEEVCGMEGLGGWKDYYLRCSVAPLLLYSLLLIYRQFKSTMIIKFFKLL
jgi:hypothetical protein